MVGGKHLAFESRDFFLYIYPTHQSLPEPHFLSDDHKNACLKTRGPCNEGDLLPHDKAAKVPVMKARVDSFDLFSFF